MNAAILLDPFVQAFVCGEFHANATVQVNVAWESPQIALLMR